MNGVDPVTAVGIYLILWWVVLFTVLPLGVRSHHDEGTTPPAGHDWGAPVNPNLKRKFLTTTWVAAIVWAVLMAVLLTGVVPLPDMPGPNG